MDYTCSFTKLACVSSGMTMALTIVSPDVRQAIQNQLVEMLEKLFTVLQSLINWFTTSC